MSAVDVGAATGALAWVALGAAVLALVPASLRWLRVAQREHYLAGATTRFAWRWWRSDQLDLGLLIVGAAGVVLAAFWPIAALGSAAVGAVAPRHLSPRGRTSPLVWTRRLRSLAGVFGSLVALVLLAGALGGVPAPVAAGAVLVSPLLVDLAAAIMAPVERRLAARFVDAAAARLRRINPVVVAVTGSYGKTSTKNHIAHLVGTARAVVATPASFNNRAGLARSINEHLGEGTEVFVAEMGTYGPGEIAEMCAWCPPTIAVITAIGPVHLERFGSEARIVASKAEITRGAGTVVLNADDPRLDRLADELSGSGRRVVRCSARDDGADVCVRAAEGQLALFVGGAKVAETQARPAVQPSNLACAVAVALALGVDEEVVAARLATLPDVPHRLVRAFAPSGLVVLDDTFNSNPAGARAALEALAGVGASHRRAVVTPGMVELGRRQAAENRAFAAAAADVATDLVVVGRTNQRALTAGAAPLRPVAVRTREEAVTWVRRHLGGGDVVLYENDLPDHYP
jgi:UDP-N-acetylmuramoyl-tripeptide--D-alanyl-D-alanine ligase